jgi:hypothetical protein
LPDSDKKKRRLWEVDPSIFEPGPRASRIRRFLIEPGKSLAKFGFFGLMFIYPLGLVILGLLFGGLVFWGAFAGSAGLIGLLLWRFGYAKNYAAWNPDFKRQLIGITVAFLLTMGFYLGLATLNIWMIPIIFSLLALAMVLVMKRARL